MDETALRDIQGAIADYEKAVELDPEDAITLNNLGLLEEQVAACNPPRNARCGRCDGPHPGRIVHSQGIRAGARARSIASPPAPPANSPWAEVKRALFSRAGRKEF